MLDRGSRKDRRLSKLAKLAAIGMAIAAGQTCFVYVLAKLDGAANPYGRLYGGDSRWYSAIAAWGYRADEPIEVPDPEHDNVAYFPAFPLLIRFISTVTGLSTALATPLAAELANWVYWTYIVMLLRKWRVPPLLRTIAIGLLLTHPSAFFLAVGYSESLFLAALLGFIYWSDNDDAISWLLAGCHGFVMTATRLVGLPLALVPILRGGANTKEAVHTWPRTLMAKVVQAFLASLGGILFFVFCQQRFGQWDLYFRMQGAWGVKPDYLAFFRLRLYQIDLWTWEYSSFLRQLNRLAAPITIGMFGCALAWECWLTWKTRVRIPGIRLALYASALLLFYTPVCGMIKVEMLSMIRHVYCVHVLLVLAIIHSLSRVECKGIKEYAFIFAATGVMVVGLWLQIALASRFTTGQWVA